ncbi:toxin VasX [Achromobacter xylosoxidans]
MAELSNARCAAAANTCGETKGKCINCDKQGGVAIMPLVPAPLPRPMVREAWANSEHGGASNTQWGIPAHRMYSTWLEKKLNAHAKVRLFDPRFDPAGLPAETYFVRVPAAGYLYVLKQDKTWDGYLLDKKGYYRKIPVAKMPEDAETTKPLSEACSSEGHNNTATQFITIDHVRSPKVWIAYSRYVWDKETRKDYEDDKDGCRTARMTELNLKDIADGKVGPGSTAPNTCKLTMPDITEIVADYAPADVQRCLNAGLHNPLQLRAEPEPQLLTSFMWAVNSKLPALQWGVGLVLPDPVGIVQELNLRRNIAAARASVLNGVLDPERARKRVIADIIQGMCLSAKANPGPFWDQSYGPERYQRNINTDAWQSALADSEGMTSLMSQIESVSALFCTWMNSPCWKQQQRSDFHVKDEAAGVRHEFMTASCVAGSGHTERERTQLWGGLWKLPIESPDNWFYRSLAAGQPEFLQVLAATSSVDEALNTVKAAVDLAAEFSPDYAKKIDDLREILRAKRRFNEATAALVDTVSGHLARLLVKDIKTYNRLMRGIAMTLVTREDLLVRPTILSGPLSEIKRLIEEAATKPIKGVAPVSLGASLPPGRGYLSQPGNLGQKGLALSESIGRSVYLDLPSDKATISSVVAFTIQKMEQGQTLSKTLTKGTLLQELELPMHGPAQVNPYLQNRIAITGEFAGMVLNVGIMFFQAQGAMNAVAAMAKDDATIDERFVGGAGAVANAMGTVSVGISMTQPIVQLVSKELGFKVVLAGARLGFYAGLVEGVATMLASFYRIAQGKNTRSAYWSMASGLATVVAGGASLGLTVAMTSGAAGVTVFGISMGPVGWTLLLVAALGVAIWTAVNAAGTDESSRLPVEYWLDNGVFGKRALLSNSQSNPFATKAAGSQKGAPAVPFASLDAELLGLERILLVASGYLMPGAVGGGYAYIHFHIAVPRYVATSRIQVVFFRNERAGPNTFRQLTAAREAKQPIVVDSPSFVPAPSFRSMDMQVDNSGKSVKISGQFQVFRGQGGFYCMKVQYWPDEVQRPGLETGFESWVYI